MTMPGINHDKLRQQRERRGGAGWKPKEGVNRIRILPPNSRVIDDWNTLENLAISYKMHFFRRQGQPTETSRCLTEHEPRKRCPACEAWRMYSKATDPALSELAKQVSPADNYLFNVLDLNGLQAGIQPWGANYTCWDKVMEIAANPMWGNVVDPACGINFEVTLTPGAKSRTGYNQYSVSPERESTTVMAILEQLPNWRATLDALEMQKTAFKTEDEIRSYLDEMGFPPAGGGTPVALSQAGRGAPAATAGIGARPAVAPMAAPAPAIRPAQAAATPVAPAPVAAPAPAVQRAPAPAVVQPVAVQPPVAAAPVAVQPAAVQADFGGAAVVGPHYDPGSEYVPVTPDDKMPPGAPRCFGDFDPRRHQCRLCPMQSDCQMALLDSDRAF